MESPFQHLSCPLTLLQWQSCWSLTSSALGGRTHSICSISLFCQYGYGSEGCVISKGREAGRQLMHLSGEGGLGGGVRTKSADLKPAIFMPATPSLAPLLLPWTCLQRCMDGCVEAFPEIRSLKAFIIYPATHSAVEAAAVTPPSTGLFSHCRHTGRLQVEEEEEKGDVGEVEKEEDEGEKVENESATGQAQDVLAFQTLPCSAYTHAWTEFCFHWLISNAKCYFAAPVYFAVPLASFFFFRWGSRGPADWRREEEEKCLQPQ